MKFIRLLVFSLFLAPFASMAASSEFTMAAQLLAAAKAADIQQVQSLVNAGANVNFVDSTGVSIVCTALMNNVIDRLSNTITVIKQGAAVDCLVGCRLSRPLV